MDPSITTPTNLRRLEQEESTGSEAANLDWGQVLLDIWSLLRRRKWHVIGSVVVGLVLGSLYLAQATPIYRATTTVMVWENNPASSPFDGQRDSRRDIPRDDYLITHAVLIKKPLIVAHACESAGLDRLASVQQLISQGIGFDATSAILEHLTVTKDTKGARMLKLSYEGTDRDDCVKIMNAIVSSYQSHVAKMHKDSSGEVADLLKLAKDDLHEEVTSKEDEYARFQEGHALALTKGASGISMALAKLDKLKAAQNEGTIQLAQLEGQIKAMEDVLAALRQDPDLEPRSVTDMLWNSSVGLNRTTSGSYEDAAMRVELMRKILGLMEEERAANVRYEAGSPTLDEIARKASTLRDFSEALARSNLQQLKMEFEARKTTAEKLDRKVEEEEQAAEEAAALVMKDEKSRKELERLRSLHAATIEQLKDVKLTENYGTIRTQVVEPTVRPKRPVKPKLSLTLAIALVFGGIFGMGLAYLADRTDKSFRSPQEIKNSLGLAIYGHIPVMSAAKLEGSNHLGCRAHDAPRSIEAEAYRTVRTGLCFSFRSQPCPVIQVTSPAPGDGKSTLVANLAISLAQTKKRVLLIDADLRRPRQHVIFGVSREKGFSNLLAAEATLDHTALATGISGVDLLPCGPIPPNPAELLTSSGFQQLLDEARRRYDYVLIDTPPVLAVADASIVAAHVDAVLMVVRISKNGRPAALHAQETLNSIGARVLGVVVNCVKQGSDGYGYHYGDKYGYSYGYGYGSYVSETADNGEGHAGESPQGDPVSRRSGDNGSKDGA